MQTRIRCALIPVFVAVAMSFLFWWPLYGGAGFIGGDLYPYFFPQKVFYTDCLKAGRFPLWNDLAGFGYPVLGESQTGAAYPFHLLTYFVLDLNTAYNAEHLLHYIVCFLGTWLFARRLGLSGVGAHLAAIVFTYGWFPPRACLEWAILTGAWLPVALWCTESFLQVRTWRYAIGLSVAIGMQLLAGHFHLAFITQLLVVTWFAYRLWSEWRVRRIINPADKLQNDRARMRSKFEGEIPSPQLSSRKAGARGQSEIADGQLDHRRAVVGFLLALMAGAGLAAIQILPTWELKQRSSRVVTGGDYDPAYGHLPPLYVSQLVAPWCWYGPLPFDEDNVVRDAAECVAPWHWFGPFRDANDRDQIYDLDRAIQRCRFAALGTGTNKVEAHCYCGIIPICLAFWAAILWFRATCIRSSRDSHQILFDRTGGYWLIAGSLALIYATGMLLPIGLHLPGFRFFRGPGRYGIVTTLAVALFAGSMLSRLRVRFSNRIGRIALMAIVFSSTCGDLWLVSRIVKYTMMINPPAIAFREASDVRRMMLAEPMPPRLLAPGPNVCNMLGVSCVPWYLGIAPAEYVDPQFAMPSVQKPPADGGPTSCTPELLEWLSRSGVTHVLNFERLDQASWQVELIWSGIDPFLNRIWGRSEPIYLYRFRTRDAVVPLDFPGRAFADDAECHITPLDWKSTPAESRRYELKSDQPKMTEVVVTELQYPGWTVRQGNTALEPKAHGMFRAVQANENDGDVIWAYQPRSVYFGAGISLFTAILLAVIAHLRFWRPALVERILTIQPPANGPARSNPRASS